VINLDWKRDGDLKNRFASQNAGKDTMREIAALIPEGLLFRVRGGEFQLLTAENTIRVEGLNFDTRAEAGNFLFSGKWSAQAELGGLFDRTFAVAMSGGIDGELSRDLDSGSVQLHIPAFSGDTFVLRPLTVNLTLTER
jgi:hypothetical protein